MYCCFQTFKDLSALPNPSHINCLSVIWGCKGKWPFIFNQIFLDYFQNLFLLIFKENIWRTFVLERTAKIRSSINLNQFFSCSSYSHQVVKSMWFAFRRTNRFRQTGREDTELIVTAKFFFQLSLLFFSLYSLDLLSFHLLFQAGCKATSFFIPNQQISKKISGSN